MTNDDPSRARSLRDQLVRGVAERTRASPRVLQALAQTPRHRFMPTDLSLEIAYRDGPHPIGHGQTISQPTIVAMMTDALNLSGTERTLEIGTGSGYQTAVLAALCREVYSIERIPELSERAASLLGNLGHTNVHLRVGDGYQGWPDAAPFDRILLTAAPPRVPIALLEQLTDSGSLVAPVGERFSQQLLRVDRVGRNYRETFLAAVAFVPMIPE